MLPIAHAFFLVGSLCILLLSVIFARRYPSPVYRYYTVAFAFTFAMVTMETARPDLVDRPLGGAFVAVLLLAGAWSFLRAADHASARPTPRWQLPVIFALGAIALACGLVGAPARWIVMIGGLTITAAMCWLGVVFLRLRATGPTDGYRWLGIGLIALGLWPVVFPYPLIQGTPLAWIGFAGSGMLQLLCGAGMLMYLLDEAWARFREEQTRHDRLKSEFVSMVSHELRTPLTSILGFSEFLEDEIAGPLAPGQRDYVRQIQESTRRLQRLVNDLLDFSRLEDASLKLEVHEADLVAHLRSVLDALTPQARKAGISLEAVLPTEPLPLLLDADRIEQVVANLVGNALKFTPPGGRVTVALTPGPDAVRLAVTDTGEGISADKLAHIFDKFYQGDSTLTRKREGAGLGLAISKAIAEAHGGSLSAESRLGEGSTFRLTLPVSRA